MNTLPTALSMIVSSFMAQHDINHVNLYQLTCPSITEMTCSVTTSIDPESYTVITPQQFIQLPESGSSARMLFQSFDSESKQTTIWYIKDSDLASQ